MSDVHHLRAFVTQVPAPIAMLDRDLRFLAVSRRYLSDCQVAEIIGRSYDEVFPDAPEVSTALRQQCLPGATGCREERGLPRADGHVQWMCWEVRPWRDEAGEVGGLLISGEDITDRKQVEAALRTSQDRLQRVLETDAVGVLFFDGTGTVIGANDVFLRMTGYARADVERRALHWRQMTPPEWIEISERQMQAFAATGRIGPYEKEYFCRDGSRRWMMFAGRDLGDGTIAEYCIDITDRKQAELELERRAAQLRRLASELTLAEKRAREQLAAMLHDGIQQLLFGVRIQLQALIRGTSASPASAVEALRQIDGHLAEAIEAARDLSLQLSPPVLRELGLAAALEWLAGWMLERYGLHVELFLDADADPVSQDVRVLVFESVRELLFNVVKHAAVLEARLELARHGDNGLRVTVSDRGKGLDATATANGGRALTSGLGLLAIRERLALLGGRTSVESAQGAGTCVTLVL